ncbi:MAG: TonB family protein [Pyrinomonadaceae bacterium]
MNDLLRNQKLVVLGLTLLFCSWQHGYGQQKDINAFYETGATPLMEAAKDGTSDEVKKILKDKPKVDIKDQYGWTSLMYAADAPKRIPNFASRGLALGTTRSPVKEELNLESLKLLLEAGADPNVNDRRGITPLMIAAFRGRVAFVGLLLKKGAKVDAMDQKGYSAFSYAKANGDKETIKLLETAGGKGIEVEKSALPGRLSPIDVLPKPLNIATEAKSDYPMEARRDGVQGVVRFRVLVGTDGKIKKILLVTGLPRGLTESATKAVKKLTVEPGKDLGQHVEYWVPIQYVFTLY